MKVSTSEAEAVTAAREAGLSALLTGATGPDGTQCPERLVLEHVTSRWGVLVLLRLLERPYRFNELRRSVGGVSEKMLSQTLQTLERDGFVHRDAHPVIPPRVDYSLTEAGREGAEHVRGLAVWTHERIGEVQRAREAYDTAKEQAAQAG